MRGTKFRLGVCPCLWDPFNGLAASERPRAFPAAGKSNVWDGFPLKNACCLIEKVHHGLQLLRFEGVAGSMAGLRLGFC